MPYQVQGRDAGTFLNRLSTANVDDQDGQITYTQWLNARGKLEADLTVAKLSPVKYLVIATDTMHRFAPRPPLLTHRHAKM